MNWKKTEEFYKAENHKYNKPQEQLDLERWEAKVMRKGEYLGKPGDPTKYPLKRLVQCKRIRALEGNEYLKGFWEYTGVDSLGNTVTTTVQDPEVYVKPHFIKELKTSKDNPNDPQPVITEVNHDELVYTMPFSPENVDKMLEVQEKRRVSFVIAEDTGTGAISPRQIANVDDFKNKPFDDLFIPLPEVGHGATKRR